MESFISAFILLCGIQGIFLSVIIFKNMDSKRHEKYFLIFIISLFSINIIANQIVSYLAKDTPDFLLSTGAFQLLAGPIFYYYCKSVAVSGFKHKLSDLINIFPFVLYVLFLMIIHIWTQYTPVLKIANRILWFLIIAEFIYYMILIKKHISDFNRELENNFSTKDKIGLDWLNYVFVAILIVLMLYFFVFILVFHNANKIISVKIFSIILSALIYFFGYKGLRLKPMVINSDVSKEKYLKSNLSQEYKSYWKDKLIQSLEKIKPHLDPELSLTKLAQITGLSENNLSQIINSELNTTFYDLINNYRIEEVKKIFLSKSEWNILDSAFAAGFNSKTAFNTIFKKKTGLTPTQFKKNIINYTPLI
jgi:AraC-like DNA-binding protein